jgi:hypothetical protein
MDSNSNSTISLANNNYNNKGNSNNNNLVNRHLNINNLLAHYHMDSMTRLKNDLLLKNINQVSETDENLAQNTDQFIKYKTDSNNKKSEVIASVV